jgi:uncharacterized protein YjbI with pentapeptide repeats
MQDNDGSYFYVGGSRNPRYCLEARCGDLSGANLRDANLSHADLRGADMTRIVAYRANLSYADLRGADLTRAVLHGADLTGANVSGVKSVPWTVCPNGEFREHADNDCGF